MIKAVYSGRMIRKGGYSAGMHEGWLLRNSLEFSRTVQHANPVYEPTSAISGEFIERPIIIAAVIPAPGCDVEVRANTATLSRT